MLINLRLSVFVMYSRVRSRQLIFDMYNFSRNMQENISIFLFVRLYSCTRNITVYVCIILVTQRQYDGSITIIVARPSSSRTH